MSNSSKTPPGAQFSVEGPKPCNCEVRQTACVCGTASKSTIDHVDVDTKLDQERVSPQTPKGEIINASGSQDKGNVERVPCPAQASSTGRPVGTEPDTTHEEKSYDPTVGPYDFEDRYGNMSLRDWIEDIYELTFDLPTKRKFSYNQKILAKQNIADALIYKMKDEEFRKAFSKPQPLSFDPGNVGPNKNAAKMSCDRCLRRGHIAARCNKPKGTCNICHQPDHLSASCKWLLPHNHLQITLDELLILYKNPVENKAVIKRAVVVEDKEAEKVYKGKSSPKVKNGPLDIHPDEKPVSVNDATTLFKDLIASTIKHDMRPSKQERTLAVKALELELAKKTDEFEKSKVADGDTPPDEVPPPSSMTDEAQGEVEKPNPQLVEDKFRIEFEYGFEYSSEEKLRALLHIPDDAKMCFNYWAIWQGGNKHHFTHHKEGELHVVDGLFEFGPYKVRILAPLPEFDNRTTAANASLCGAIVFGESVLPGTRTLDPRGNATFRLNMASCFSRIESSVRAVAYKLVDDKSYTTASAVNKIRSHFKLCFDVFPELDGFILEYIKSPMFYTIIDEFQQREQQSWPKKAEASLRYIYQRKGFDSEKFEGDVAHNLCKKKCRRTMVCMAVGVASLITGPFCPVTWAAADRHLVDRIDQWTMVPIKLDKRAVYQDMLKKESDSYRMGIMPCSKLYIRKMVHSKRQLPVQAPGVVIKADYESMEEEKKVEVYGSTMTVPAVYPVNCAENLEAALRIRMAFERKFDKLECHKFKNFCAQLLKTLPDLEIQKIDELKYLKDTYGDKKGQLYYDLRSLPIDKRDAKAEIFVKGEMYLGKDESNFKPRMIWSRGPKLVGHFSSTFYQITEQIKWKWFKVASGNRVMYCSGTNPMEVGTYAQYMIGTHSLIYEADVSNWDGSMADHFLDVELMILKKVLNLPANFAFLIDNWKNVSGANRDKTLTVKLPYGRRSGDLWTSIFNSVLNWFVTMYALNCKIDGDYNMLVLGDDNVVGYGNPETRLDEVQQNICKKYEGIGMRVELAIHEDVKDAGFCSGYFWTVDGNLIWGVKPFRTLCKYGVNHHNQPEKMFRSLLLGIAKSQMTVSSYVPILGAFQRAIIQSGCEDGVKAAMPPVEWWKIGSLCDTDFGGPSADTRDQFCDIYGIPPFVQILIEEWITNNIDIDSFPFLIVDEMFTDCAKLEMGCGDEFENMDILSENPTSNSLYGDARNEEIEKLASGNNLVTRLLGAWRYGAEEDDLLDHSLPTHAFLHTLFTFVSSISLPLGVALHVTYNQTAYRVAGLEPCRKSGMKPKPKPKKVKKTRSARAPKQDKAPIRSLVKATASMVGNMMAGNLGSRIAERGVDLISKVTGYGDYKVKSNTLMSGSIPEFSKTGHTIRIRHREYLGDILSSATFVNTEYGVNPGNSITFPWLSTLASSYTQYKFHGLIFAFNSTSATALNSTNTSLGTVVMATQYDVALDPFTTKIEMEAHEFSCATKPSESSMHPIECSPAESPTKFLYIRSGALPAGTDPRWYDFCNFNLATIGSQAVSNIGELWVTYDVELAKTRLPSAGPTPGLFYNCRRNTVTSAAPLGIVIPSMPSKGTLDVTITSTTITFNRYTAGRFLLMFQWASPTGVTMATNPGGFMTFSGGLSLAPFTAVSEDTQPFFINEAGSPTSSNAQAQPQTGLAGITSVGYQMIMTLASVPPAVGTITFSNIGGNLPRDHLSLTIVSLPTSNTSW